MNPLILKILLFTLVVAAEKKKGGKNLKEGKGGKPAKGAKPAKKVPLSPAYDDTTNSLVFDRSKCISCQACVRACKTVAGMNIIRAVPGEGKKKVITAVDGKPFSETDCVKCGQCTLVCKPGAIMEKDQIKEVEAVLKNPGDKITTCQVAPAVRIAISEAMGLPEGTISTGKLVTALKQLGFKYVFDTNYGADMTIVEEATELVSRLTKGTAPLPMFTSCCPAWVNYVEQSAPELIPHLSSCRSPMSMLAPVVKEEFSQMMKVNINQIYHVGIMPCIAKKDEIERPQLVMENGDKIVDKVISTRELARWIKEAGINYKDLPESNFDEPYSEASGGGAIFCATGGVMEAAVRTAYHIITGKELSPIEFEDARGLDGIKIGELDIEGKHVKIAVAQGILNAQKLIAKIKKGDPRLKGVVFVEVMACPGGCVNGGGAPKAKNKKAVEQRLDSTYEIDEKSKARQSHNNKQLNDNYDRFIGEPNGHKAHEILHTHFNDRSKKDDKKEKKK